MEQLCGSLNSAGFTTAIDTGYLPPHDHLTYPGVFNELRYNVGPKTDKVLDIHHGYARFQFAQSKFDNQIHDYLALFTKGKANGQIRDSNRRLNSVICLDISGSMTCRLDRSNQSSKSRLDLSIEAIKMFISKLQPEDSVGMTTFDGKAHLIFEPILKKNIDEGVYAMLDKIKACGSNDLMAGFDMSKELILKQMKTQTQNFCYENRVIVLSDVCDQSITQSLHVIKNAANEHDIHLTIVGISTDFNSQTCEDLKGTKGFNYFCATNNEDIMKYLFETFDYTFFPSSSDIVMSLEAENVSGIEVFGTSDQIKVQPFEQASTTKGNSFVITRSPSYFPSEIEIEKNQVYTVGGLILVKLTRKVKSSSFKGKINLSYKDTKGCSLSQNYDIDYEFHPEEQFISDEILREALCAFCFVSELKTILKESSQISKSKIYQRYFDMLINLKKICPTRKEEDLKKVIDIVKKYKHNEPAIMEKEEIFMETVKEKVK